MEFIFLSLFNQENVLFEKLYKAESLKNFESTLKLIFDEFEKKLKSVEKLRAYNSD